MYIYIQYPHSYIIMGNNTIKKWQWEKNNDNFGLFVRDIVRFIGPLLGATNREQEILALLIIHGKINTFNRSKVRELLKMTPENFNTQLLSLRKKGILVSSNYGTTYSDTIQTIVNKVKSGKEVEFTFRLTYKPVPPEKRKTNTV